MGKAVGLDGALTCTNDRLIWSEMANWRPSRHCIG